MQIEYPVSDGCSFVSSVTVDEWRDDRCVPKQSTRAIWVFKIIRPLVQHKHKTVCSSHTINIIIVIVYFHNERCDLEMWFMNAQINYEMT